MTEKQSLACNLYMQTGLTQQKIAEITGVNRKTLYEWMKQGNWTRARTASAHAPGILLDQYYGQLVSLNESIALREETFPTREDTVIMTRVNSVIKTLLPDKKSLAKTIEHFTDFSEIAKERFPELGDQIATLIKDYITDVLVAPVPYTQLEFSNSQSQSQQSQSPIPIFLSLPKGQNTDGVQNGASAIAVDQPKAATSKEFGDLQNDKTPQQTIQKWGASGELRNTSLPFGEGRGEALPPPRNRAERRAQERMLKKAHKSLKKAA